MSDEDVQALAAEGLVERVEPDPETARQELQTARRHIQSARRIARDDTSGAFAIGYDAMRKANSAHMRARGYRVKPGKGHHHRTGRYALAALDHLGIADHVEAFEDLRQMRNQSEYDVFTVEIGDVEEAISHAEALVTAIAEDLGS
ncbi:MAG: HEPN domain-containing protein [Actinomycetota bacterium]